MFTSPRTLSLFVFMLAACSGSEGETSDPGPEQVGGGQSGTDSSGALGERCDPEGDPEPVSVSEVIDELGRSAEDLSAALEGTYSVPCIGGDSVDCDAMSPLIIDVATTGSATVQRGTRVYFVGEEVVDNGEPEPCAYLSIAAEVHLHTADGTLDVTATALGTTRGNYAALSTVAPTTLFGDEQDIDVHVSFVGVTDTPRAIDAVLELDPEHRALYSWDSDDQINAAGAGGGDNPGVEDTGGYGGQSW